MRDNDQILAGILLALDRCEHGRHKGDACSGPNACEGGVSQGNSYLEPGQRIGTDLYGRAIIYPNDHRVMGLSRYWASIPAHAGSQRPNPV